MNKIEMTNFLSFIAKIAKQNENVVYHNENDCNTIYHHLTRYGISDEEKKYDISQEGFFAKWIEYFKDKENINVFVDPRWKYFCQFANYKRDSKENIKIYVPTKHDFLLENAKIIFEFIRKENIVHLSKISKAIRFDNIVIRLTNKQDADKLINFISNNPQIQKGLSKPNPFAFNKNNLPIVCDGNLSYNTIVSDYIGMYIQNKKNKNQLDNVNSDDFIQFVATFYKEVFQEKKHFDKCKDYFCVNFNIMNNPNVVNFKNITELIIKSYQDEFTYDDFIDHFNNCNNPDFIRKEMDNIKNSVIYNDTDLLREYFQVMEGKYNLETAINGLVIFFKTGDNHGITRDNDLRNKMTSFGIRGRLNEYFKKNNFTLADMRNYLLKFSSVAKKSISVSRENQELFNEYLIIMTNKYGLEMAVDSFQFYLISGRTDSITRDNNLRSKIHISNLRKEFNEYFNDKNFQYNDIHDWIMNYYNNLVENKQDNHNRSK